MLRNSPVRVLENTSDAPPAPSRVATSRPTMPLMHVCVPTMALRRTPSPSSKG